MLCPMHIPVLLCGFFGGAPWGMAAFVGGAVTGAIPGIILQLIVIPIVVITLEKIQKQD